MWALYANGLCANPQFCTHIFLFLLYEGACARAGWQFFSRADFTYLFQFHIQWYPVSSLKLPIVRICNLHMEMGRFYRPGIHLFAGKPALSAQYKIYNIHYIKLPAGQLNIQLDSFYYVYPTPRVKIPEYYPKHSSCHILSGSFSHDVITILTSVIIC